MADPNWERYSAGAGLAAAVLLAVQAFLAPLYPSFGDPPLDVAQYYRSNVSAIRVQILLTGFAGLLFLWFLGSLRAYLRRSEGDTGRISAVAFGAGVAVLGPLAVGVLAMAASAHAVGGSVSVPGMGAPGYQELLGLAAVGPLHDMRLLSYALGWFALAPLLLATAVVSARSGAFPRWYMNASYALFLLSLGASLSVLLDTGLFAPGGAYDLALFGLFVVWLGATSWLMMQAFAPPAETPATATEVPEPPPAP